MIQHNGREQICRGDIPLINLSIEWADANCKDKAVRELIKDALFDRKLKELERMADFLKPKEMKQRPRKLI